MMDKQKYEEIKTLIEQFELEIENDYTNNDNPMKLTYSNCLYGFKRWLLHQQQGE